LRGEQRLKAIARIEFVEQHGQLAFDDFLGEVEGQRDFLVGLTGQQ
jgi:hypothetical protein